MCILVEICAYCMARCRSPLPNSHIFLAKENCHREMKKWRTWLDIGAKGALIGRGSRAESRLYPCPAGLQALS